MTALLEVVRLSVFESTMFQKMTQFPPLFEGQSKVIYDTGLLSEPVMKENISQEEHYAPKSGTSEFACFLNVP